MDCMNISMLSKWSPTMMRPCQMAGTTSWWPSSTGIVIISEISQSFRISFSLNWRVNLRVCNVVTRQQNMTHIWQSLYPYLLINISHSTNQFSIRWNCYLTKYPTTHSRMYRNYWMKLKTNSTILIWCSTLARNNLWIQVLKKYIIIVILNEGL